MAQDIRDMFKADKQLSSLKMPPGHEKRFRQKVEDSLPGEINRKRSSYSIWRIAASIVILIGLLYGSYHFMDPAPEKTVVEVPASTMPLKSLGDVSPSLKKVEDYYMANINLELSNVNINKENKELIDGYIFKLEELNKEYLRLSQELTDSGPNELMVGALIDNLKLRLNLLYRLKEQLKDWSNADNIENQEHI